MGRAKIKPEITLKNLGVNPFLQSLLIPVRLLPVTEYMADVDGDMMPKEVFVESQPYTKVFVSSEARIIVNGFTEKGKCMYLWLMYELEKSKDYIWINKDRYMKEHGIKSYNTYLASINEMCRYGVLNRSNIKDVYWMNPSFFFRGSRVNCFKDKLIKP